MTNKLLMVDDAPGPHDMAFITPDVVQSAIRDAGVKSSTPTPPWGGTTNRIDNFDPWDSFMGRR